MIARLVTRDARLGLGLAFALLAPAAHAQLRPATSASYVAARPLMRGQVITTDDVRTAPGMTSRESRVAPVVGWVARRAIAAGEVLRTPAVAPPAVIEPGQSVKVVWREPGIEVRLNGVAVNAAASGEHVVVRIDGGARAPSRRLEGTAVAPGLVQIQ